MEAGRQAGRQAGNHRQAGREAVREREAGRQGGRDPEGGGRRLNEAGKPASHLIPQRVVPGYTINDVVLFRLS